MLTVFQTDDLGLLQGGARQEHGKSHRQVLVAPPAVPAGHVARWFSALHPVADTQTYGDAGTGAWEVVEDHRKDTLWIERGKQYALGTDHQGQSYDGLGPIPGWLLADEPPAPPPTLAETQATQLEQINRDFEAAAKALTTGYPEAERLTWPMQQAEAMAWGVNEAAATPYLDGLAAARGIDPAEMRQLTLDQVSLFMSASQALVGTRQRLRDSIHTAETVEDVLAVAWPSGGQA